MFMQFMQVLVNFCGIELYSSRCKKRVHETN